MTAKQARLQALQQQVERLQRRLDEFRALSGRYATVRLILAIIAFFGSAAALYWAGIWAFTIFLGVAIVAFAAAVIVHRQLDNTIRRFEIWQQHQQTQIARMTHAWADIPPRPAADLTSLEVDFDLAGQRSLTHLIDTATSQAGSQRLRQWLANPIPDLTLIAKNQLLIRELSADSLLRSRLLLAARLATADEAPWSTDQLLDWLSQETAHLKLRSWVILLAVVAAINIVLFILYSLGQIPPWWQYTLLAYLVLSFINVRELRHDIFTESANARDALAQLAAVFAVLEGHHYRAQPNLQALCRPFLETDARPSAYLHRLGRIVSATSLRRNPFLWLFLNLILPWDYYFVWRLAQQRATLAVHLPYWLDIWHDVEALSSLANFAYLNPHYVFPHVAHTHQPGREPVFQARRLGHPLIPDAEKICNDFTLQNLSDIALITGSNMAGKSSFLRTVGVNLALTCAGSPVDAAALHTLPFRRFSSIKVADSVTDGISYFYAEVRRLKAMLDELDAPNRLPLFFFIDEIFRGTNNRERLIGSQAYIKALTGKFGVGLISTHDLELVSLAEVLPGILNYHFREEVVDGRMRFDYSLRPGPSPTTNALKIMALAGLPITPIEPGE